jgi:uncharacterized membrane protein YqgA involved in biofilm formation
MEMFDVYLNSGLNLLANLIMFIGGFMFYYNSLELIKNKTIYRISRVSTAMLVTGSLSRVLFDLNIILTGQVKYFDWFEAAIALTRNLGFGVTFIIVVFLLNKKHTQNGI